MLSSVYQAVDAEEHNMNPLKRLFTGQRWYLKTALAVFALAAITALAFIVPSLDIDAIRSDPAMAYGVVLAKEL